MLSTVFSDRQLRDEFLADLADWMRGQRWYSGASEATPVLQVSGWVRLGDTPQRTTTFATFVADSTDRYAVPVTWTYLDEVAFADAEALISTLDTPSGRVYITDATGVDASRRVLCEALVAGTHVGEGIRVEAFDSAAAFGEGTELGAITATSRVSGEQSNTSIIAHTTSGTSVIMKLYRRLEAGPNPDITLQQALQARGSRAIAPLLGAVRLTDAVGDSDAALVQEFIAQTQDAWLVALDSAREGSDFSREAASLGRTVAQVHADVAQALEAQFGSINNVKYTLDAMKARLSEFVAEVPELAAFEARIAEAYDDAAHRSWPKFQRIHGDLHLGQVIHGRDGWILLDFEGEPLRPMRERINVDSPARDVAGMLRSFDYAAAFVRLKHGTDTGSWAASAREAFLDAYLEHALVPSGSAGDTVQDMRALIRVFEIDKAAYECVYEERNRPEWASIPLDALERLLG